MKLHEIYFIGTGASCVYPILGCRKNGWTFVASEVDELNYKTATSNVARNGMVDQIKG